MIKKPDTFHIFSMKLLTYPYSIKCIIDTSILMVDRESMKDSIAKFEKEQTAWACVVKRNGITEVAIFNTRYIGFFPYSSQSGNHLGKHFEFKSKNQRSTLGFRMYQKFWEYEQ